MENETKHLNIIRSSLDNGFIPEQLTEGLLLDWRDVAIIGCEELIVSAYIDELGKGRLTTLAATPIGSLAEEIETVTIYGNLTSNTMTSFNTLASSITANLISAGYYNLLYSRFIGFTIVQEKLRGITDEKLTSDTLLKAFTCYIAIQTINYIVTRNTKQIRTGIAKAITPKTNPGTTNPQ